MAEIPLSLQSQASYLTRPHFPPPTVSCWGTVLILGGVGCFLSIMCVRLCVYISQEWKRGEANGLAYSTQRQLPRERRAQGRSKARSLAFSAPSGKSLGLRKPSNWHWNVSSFIFPSGESETRLSFSVVSNGQFAPFLGRQSLKWMKSQNPSVNKLAFLLNNSSNIQSTSQATTNTMTVNCAF